MRSRPGSRAAAAVLGLTLAASGRAETFDVFSFTAPPGWARENKTGVVVFFEQLPGGGSCLAALYAGREGSGDPERDFREEWDLTVVKQLRFETPPEVARSRTGAWTRLVGTIEVLQGGREAVTELHVFSAGRRVASFLANRADEGCAGELAAFVRGVSPASPGPHPAPAPAVAAPAPAGRGGKGPSFAGPAPVGVWIGSTTGAMRGHDSGRGLLYDAVKRKLAWRVLFADGQAFSGMPTTGLADLDVERSKAEEAAGRFVGGSWGTWSLSGARGSLRKALGGATEELALADGDHLRVGGRFDFVRAADVTGLRLDGEWTHFSDPRDPWLDQPGCRQVIRFSRDGRFVDRGIFVSDTRFPDRSPEDAPGEGTYEIRDFSLVLRYADGRVVLRSLTGIVGGDPRRDDGVLLVLGQPWTKRR
jgi:hypothetical protein